MLMITAKAWSASPFQNVESARTRKPLTAAEKEQLVRKIRTLGNLLDNRFTLPGTGFRFGWDGIIGLIPGFGDIATGALAAYIVYLAHQLDVPKALIGKMMVNVAIDLSAGLVPVVGDALDFAWKANLKNIRLLEQHLLKESSTTASVIVQDERRN